MWCPLIVFDCDKRVGNAAGMLEIKILLAETFVILDLKPVFLQPVTPIIERINGYGKTEIRNLAGTSSRFDSRMGHRKSGHQ